MSDPRDNRETAAAPLQPVVRRVGDILPSDQMRHAIQQQFRVLGFRDKDGYELVNAVCFHELLNCVDWVKVHNHASLLRPTKSTRQS